MGEGGGCHEKPKYRGGLPGGLGQIAHLRGGGAWRETLKYRVGVQPQGSSIRHSNTGLVSSMSALTSWGQSASLALVNHPSSGVTIKMPYGVDVLHQPALHPIFSYWVG